MKSIQNDISPSSGFKEQLLADIMKEKEMAIDQLYLVPNDIVINLIKLTVPLTMLLTLFMRIEAF
jgi:hypothetical protein